MLKDQEVEFSKLIVKNLESNGFPMKIVSLPLETLYEKALERDANLNTILDDLEENSNISNAKEGDKIIFSKIVTADTMFQQAQDMMTNMGPEELKQMQDMVQNMSGEERDAMMDKAKKMGLV